jgi:hypothetical protein
MVCISEEVRIAIDLDPLGANSSVINGLTVHRNNWKATGLKVYNRKGYDNCQQKLQSEDKPAARAGLGYGPYQAQHIFNGRDWVRMHVLPFLRLSILS